MAKRGPKTELENERLALNRNEIEAINARVRLEAARGRVKLLTLEIKTLKEVENLRRQAIEILETAEARGEAITAEDLKQPTPGDLEPVEG